MRAFVGADGKRPRDLREGVVAPGRQRLLDQRDAGLRAGGEVSGQIVRGPGLVGVDDQFGARRRPPHRVNACRVLPASELDLQQRAIGGPGGGLRPRVGRCERDRVSGGDGLRWRKAQEFMHPTAALPGCEIPERTVESVARRARRHRGLQALAIEAVRDRIGHGLDRRRHPINRLAIACIGHAFAAAVMAAVGEIRHHHDGFGLGAAADRERARDRPAFDADGEGGGRPAHRPPRRIAWAPATALQAPGRRAGAATMSRFGIRTIPATVMVAVCVSAAFCTTAAHAQTAGADNSAIYLYKGADRDQRLIAKAREEGTLTFYTSMATTESGPLAQAFEKKYGVKVQLWRALSENVLQRALTEARGGRRSMDVVETNAPEVEALAREQAVAEFDSPYLADLPAWAIPPHRRWFSDRANLWVTGYNTGKVKREELPATVDGF